MNKIIYPFKTTFLYPSLYCASLSFNFLGTVLEGTAKILMNSYPRRVITPSYWKDYLKMLLKGTFMIWFKGEEGF